MRVSETIVEWLERRRSMSSGTIGFVPTMGALHRGHASLVRRCRAENDTVVVSLFVNPSQFNNPQDLERYPRTIENDLALLEDLGTDEVFVPSPAGIYPRGYRFRVEPGSLAESMEGSYRPGFFPGVMTVVLKLLNLVRPHRAYFGEKDYQQLRMIAEMAAEFFIPVDIVACPTVREESGLAESSRNVLLSAAGRKRAALIFRTLTGAGTSREARSVLEKEGFAVDYVEEHWGRRLAAVTLDGVRLIDNVPLAPPGVADASLP